MKSSAALVLLVLFFTPTLLERAHGQLIGPNIDITGDDSPHRQRVEPTIAVDPRDPSVLVAGAQDLGLKASGGHRWLSFYRSTDRGLTWSASLLPGYPGDSSPEGAISPLRTFNATSDPVLAFDRYGNAYYAGIAFNVHPTGGLGQLTAFVARYVNDGADYSSVTIILGEGADKPWIAVDTSGGHYDGNVYLVFDYGCGFPVCFARSTDGARTFSAPMQLPTGLGIFPGITVGTNGDIFVSVLGLGNPLVTDLGFGTIIVTKSTDGGLSFQKPVVAADRVSPLLGTLRGNLFRTFTIPQIAADENGVYLVWDNFKDNDAQVLFVRSTDGGVSWSRPVTVNDLKRGHQFFPSIAVSAGVISVVWYDGRVGQLPNGTITSLDVFYSFSVNGGVDFSPNMRVTTTSFDPNLVLRTDAPNTLEPFMGDYIHLAASAGTVHPIWADNRNACDTIDPTFGCVGQDIFTATIHL